MLRRRENGKKERMKGWTTTNGNGKIQELKKMGLTFVEENKRLKITVMRKLSTREWMIKKTNKK